MYRTQILLEPEQHQILTEIARQEKRSLSDLLREMVDKQIAERKRMALAAAAQTLLVDYQTDQELTAFRALDGDDFHA
ncbi:MAG TPA: ribbon-helix-helix domain-containing protein [Anaerolineaceae bacterium]|jgi:predicted DNA-binding ribbon-helix-helix protein|nr:ribbon-helix-helix domain-containing protein [Anaerolineaceae bacterium]